MTTPTCGRAAPSAALATRPREQGLHPPGDPDRRRPPQPPQLPVELADLADLVLDRDALLGAPGLVAAAQLALTLQVGGGHDELVAQRRQLRLPRQQRIMGLDQRAAQLALAAADLGQRSAELVGLRAGVLERSAQVVAGH